MNYLFVALFGLVLGSFLNVCIARIPLGLSVVRPRSRCPGCHHPIRWYDNVPVLSYLLLRGRCRDCEEPISIVYPLVEILNAALLLAAYAVDGPTLQFLRDVVFLMILLVLVFTDLFERRLPDVLTIPGIAFGLVVSWFVPVEARPVIPILSHYGVTVPPALISPLGAVSGALAGGGLFFLIREAAYIVLRKEALGFGDVKLMAMIGVFLGVPLTLATVLLGSVLASFVAIPFELLSRRYRHFHWPYGSFLGAAGIYACLWGNQLFEAYLRWAGVLS